MQRYQMPIHNGTLETFNLSIMWKILSFFRFSYIRNAQSLPKRNHNCSFNLDVKQFNSNIRKNFFRQSDNQMEQFVRLCQNLNLV